MKIDKLDSMLAELSRGNVATSSDKFAEIVNRHGFEHVRSEDNGSFVVRDISTEKYFLVDSDRTYKEIEKP